MKIVGIVGGMASGKSRVTSALKRLGAFGINVDSIVHEVLKLPEIAQQIDRRWGEAHPDIWHKMPGCKVGPLDRSAVAKIVFADPEELKFLETITYRPVLDRVQQSLALFDHQYTTAVILDAPLLMEMDWDKRCDVVLFIDTPYDDRLNNFLNDPKRDPHKTAHDFDARESQQMPLTEKRKRAHRVIRNHRTQWHLTQTQIEAFWNELPGMTTVRREWNK